MLVRLVHPWKAESPMLVTLLLLAKLTFVIVVWFPTQFAGMFPVFVSPTCTPEELKALEVVIVELPITTDLSLMPAMFIVKFFLCCLANLIVIRI